MFQKRRYLIFGWLVLFTAQACFLSNMMQSPVGEAESTPSTAPDVTALATPQPTEPGEEPPTDLPTRVPTREPDPAEFIDILPIDQGNGEVLLWAGGVMASSSSDRDAYHARQVLGKPNTLACGRFVTAWQPAPEETEAWIELYYFPYILPSQLLIQQSYLPGQLSKIEVVTLDDETFTIFDRDVDEVYQPNECPAVRGFWLLEVDVLISTVRISLVREPEEAWTQIDAVGVLGLIGDGPTEPMEIDDWAEDVYSEFYEDFYAPRFYTNKNRINALTFAGNKLVTATDGGVVVWDTNSLWPTPYTAAQGLPSNVTTAIAYCGWDFDPVVVGGPAGIATFNPDLFDMILSLDETYFFKVEHPDYEPLGTVTALACDAQRDQIWVGYPGHLSRYDLATQSWLEFSQNDGMPFDVVRQIKIIGDEVWVATAYGVAVVRGGDQLTAYTPENSSIPSQFVHAIAADKAGILWMASSNGLIEFDGQTWRLWESADIAGAPMVNLMMGLDSDPSGKLWIADNFGILCEFDPVTRTCLQVLEPWDDLGGITAFHVDPLGRKALGDFKDGVRFILDDEWFPLRTKDQLQDNVIHAITYAPDGNLWVASRAGVQYFPAHTPERPWQEMPLPERGQPHAFYVASDGLWIGHTRGARFLPYLDEEPFDLKIGDADTLIDRTVTAITVDQMGLVYFGSSGLHIWDGSTFDYQDLLSDAARARESYPPRVNALYADGDVVWVAASNGLYRFVQGQLSESWGDELLDLTGRTASVGVVVPAPDGEGLLVGVGSNLYRFNADQFELVLALGSEIRSLTALPYALMLATGSQGLYSIPKDDFGIYWELASGGDNFASSFGYQAIVMSDMHTLWVASLEGGLRRTQALFGQ